MLANRMRMIAGGGVLPPVPASISYTGYASAAFATTVTFSGMPIGTAAADRVVFVIVCIKPGSTYRSLTGATIGGVTATIHGQTNDSTFKYNVALISALVPTGTTAAVALTFSGSGSGNVYLGLYAAYGLQSTSPVDLVTNSWTPSQQANPMTSTLQVQKDGILIFGGTMGSSSQSFDTSAAIKDFQDTIASYSPQGWAFMGAHADIDADDPSYSVSITGSAGVHYDHHLVASFR